MDYPRTACSGFALWAALRAHWTTLTLRARGSPLGRPCGLIGLPSRSALGVRPWGGPAGSRRGARLAGVDREMLGERARRATEELRGRLAASGLDEAADEVVPVLGQGADLGGREPVRFEQALGLRQADVHVPHGLADRVAEQPGDRLEVHALRPRDLADEVLGRLGFDQAREDGADIGGVEPPETHVAEGADDGEPGLVASREE